MDPEPAPEPYSSEEDAELNAILGGLQHLVGNANKTIDTDQQEASEIEPTPAQPTATPIPAPARLSIPEPDITPTPTPTMVPRESAPSNEVAQPTSANARLESRTHVTQPKRRQFWHNFQSQQKESRLEHAISETVFAESLRGKLTRWRLTSWLFHRQSRRVDLITLVSVLAVVSAVAWSLRFSNKEAESAISVETVTPIKSDGQALLIGKEESARLVEQFFASESVDQISPMVRHPDIIKPLMDRWYATHPVVPRSVLEFGESRIKEFGDSRYYLHFVLLPEENDPRPIAIEETPDGYKVDWETAVGYQAMDWEVLQKTKPQETVYMRVVAADDNYHNFQFMDANVWVCRRLSHPMADSVLYGYTKRHSKTDEAFTNMLKDKKQAADYFILGIRFPENPQTDNVVIIDEVLQSKWVIDYEDGQRHFDLSAMVVE